MSNKADHLEPYSDRWYQEFMGEGVKARIVYSDAKVWTEIAVRKAILQAIEWAYGNPRKENE